MNNLIESKKLDIQIKRPMIQLISNIVYEQRPNFVSPNAVLKMDVLKYISDEKMPAVVFITGGGFISANKYNCRDYW